VWTTKLLNASIAYQKTERVYILNLSNNRRYFHKKNKIYSYSCTMWHTNKETEWLTSLSIVSLTTVTQFHCIYKQVLILMWECLGRHELTERWKNVCGPHVPYRTWGTWPATALVHHVTKTHSYYHCYQLLHHTNMQTQLVNWDCR